MKVLQFTVEEQMQLFRTVAAVLHFGNIEIKQRPREEQAEMQNTEGELSLSLSSTRGPSLEKRLRPLSICCNNPSMSFGDTSLFWNPLGQFGAGTNVLIREVS